VSFAPWTSRGCGRLVERGGQLVEVLPEDEYGWGRLPGAVNIPLKAVTAQGSRAG